MPDRLISNQIDSTTIIKSREILDVNENQPFLNILLPEVLERLVISESVMHLDRSTVGFNGLPGISTTPNESVTRAIIVNDRDKFLYQQINDRNGKGLALFENGIQISNNVDVKFPIEDENSLKEVSMRNLLTTFCNSTLRKLETLPSSPVISQPAFRFSSMYSGKHRPTEHLAIVQVTPKFWE